MRATTMATVVGIAEMIVDIGTTTTDTEMESMNGDIVNMGIMAGDMATMTVGNMTMAIMAEDTMAVGMTD
jgi:hypothetical protein